MKKPIAQANVEAPTAGPGMAREAEVPLPRYLEQTYWWAYLHPRGVRFFERQWLVNLILWGNYRMLRDAALAELGPSVSGRVLQVACVYGDFTERLADRVAGVVMVEETTNNIQILQRNAMVSLINKTLAVFAVVTLALLGFATRLSLRLRRLSNEAAAAIDEQGRVTGRMSVSAATDEIGDLSRNYAAMLERLRQYNLYLESLAGKLSHELRTPMAVVQSSLENLRTEAAGRGEIYLDRAQDGMRRLNLLVTRLSEAARLEQALQSAEKETIELCRFLRKSMDGYRAACPTHTFNLSVPATEVSLRISQDLFLQMLDKIIANAVDFSSPSEPVEVRLVQDKDSVRLSVTNHGPLLPESMQGELFNSMVSVRNKKGKEAEPHLGLGLYIARMIAEYHGGRIRAENLAGKDGVCFTLIFPGEG